MIEHLLNPLISERFLSEPRYREGHLRIVNALPTRRVLGLHSPEMKHIAKQISHEGCEILLPDGTRRVCANGREVIRAFESVAHEGLCYEEIAVWGFLINHEKSSLEDRLEMLAHYVPVLDNWAVCDSYCSHAKWMVRADKRALWQFLGQWFSSDREFEVRFALVVSMCYFLNEEWLGKVFEQLGLLDLSRIKSDYHTAKGKPKVAQQGTVVGAEPYYVRMGIAWLLATALAKFPERTREFIRGANLPPDIVKLYVRKARESFRTRSAAAL